MENTLENKAKFFALYWGQRVWVYRANSDTQALLYIDKSTMYHKTLIYKDQYLLLTPLSQITDEHKIQVAKLVCYRHNRHYKPEEITYKICDKRALDILVIVNGRISYKVQITNDGIAFIEYSIYVEASDKHYYCPNQYEVTRFLLGEGYYIGYGTEVSFGWVKLKES